MTTPEPPHKLLQASRQGLAHGAIAAFSIFITGVVTNTVYQPEMAIAPLVGMVITYVRYKLI